MVRQHRFIIIRASLASGRPVFIGEFGETGGSKGAPKQKWLLQWIDEAKKTNVSLIALWGWHFPWQPDLTMDEKNTASVILRCKKFNHCHAAAGKK